MKIAIIGAGWVGCHLAQSLLSDNHKVTLYEADDVFSSASYHNQNRLHLGFHYARNQRTRNLCKNTFERFEKDYREFVTCVDSNIYAVHNQSVVDFGTYLAILDSEGLHYDETYIKGLKSIEGSINTKEKHINYIKIKPYFKNKLKKHIKYQKVERPEDLSGSYDFVINCTNNAIKSLDVDAFYETALTLVYKKIAEIEFDALTVVDGDFFSIYPYRNDLYTLTDVEFTPVHVSNSYKETIKFQKSLTIKDVKNVRSNILDKVIKICPDFLNKFEYHGYFASTKSKTYNMSADRYPVISINGNIISCFTGKIQGIYVIEDAVKNHIKNYE